MTAAFSRQVAPVSDLEFDMRLGPVSPISLDRRAAFLRSLGFERMYIIAPPPGYPLTRFLPFGRDADGSRLQRWGLRSMLNLTAPFAEAVAAAHRHGLEAYAVFKPYEGGGLWSAPEGRDALLERNHLPQLGGPCLGLDPFVAAHPDLRVMRRPEADAGADAARAIATLELVYCLDEVRQRSSTAEVVYPAQPHVLAHLPALQGAQVWTSTGNGTYTAVGDVPTVTESIEDRVLSDANGQALPGTPHRCRVIRLSGLHIPASVPYAAVSLTVTDPRAFVTIPFSMVTARDADGKVIDATVSDRFRDAAEKPREGEIGTLCHYGFEFEPIGFSFWDPGWRPATCVGIARGRMAFLKGTLCEAYADVRDYWLRQIDGLIQAGADGVDIRLQNHSSAVSDYTAYGYNPPLLDACRAAGAEPAPLDLMRARGVFFLDFAAAARERLHACGRRLQLHLRACYEQPVLSGDHNQLGFWAMPKILPDWRRMVDLADEITIKDYGFGCFDPDSGAGIRRRAARDGKPVWVHCYLQQGGELNSTFCAAAEADESVTGLLLYEIAYQPEDRRDTASGLVGVAADGSLIHNPDTVAALERLTRYAKQTHNHTDPTESSSDSSCRVRSKAPLA